MVTIQDLIKDEPEEEIPGGDKDSVLENFVALTKCLDSEAKARIISLVSYGKRVSVGDMIQVLALPQSSISAKIRDWSMPFGVLVYEDMFRKARYYSVSSKYAESVKKMLEIYGACRTCIQDRERYDKLKEAGELSSQVELRLKEGGKKRREDL